MSPDWPTLLLHLSQSTEDQARLAETLLLYQEACQRLMARL